VAEKLVGVAEKVDCKLVEVAVNFLEDLEETTKSIMTMVSVIKILICRVLYLHGLHCTLP